VSSVVAETNSQLPASQTARARQGQTGQTGQSSGGGFSGLVDENLAASNDPAPAERPRPAREATATESGRRTTTGIQPRTRNPSEPAQRSSADAGVDGSEPSADDADTPITVRPELATETVVVAAETEVVDAALPTDAEEVQPAAPAPAPATTIVAAAVAVQIELSGEAPVSVIDSNDAITITNPPATVIASPAATAANALARVANDTGDNQAIVATEAQAQLLTETDIQPPTETADTSNAPAPAPTTDADTIDIAAGAKASAEVAVQVETAEGDAQLNAKAATELSAATAKPADTTTKPLEQKATPVIASIEPKLSKPRDEMRVAPEPTSEQNADAKPINRLAESREASGPRADAPIAPERPARPVHETPVAHVTHAPASPSENAQPSGFGVTQVAPLHVPSFATPAAGFTAVAASTIPIPMNGLAVEIVANAQIGRSRFEIRLDPPELGRIDVRLDVDRQGQVTSHLFVEKSATLDLLRRDAQQLERALQDAGLKTSDNGLQFSLRDQQQQAGRNDDNGSQRAHRLVVTEEETVATEVAGRSYGRMASLRGGIDIRV
jgi:flagellar hook-length control protein FliK